LPSRRRGGGRLPPGLAKAGTDVVLIARGPHLEAMRESGLRLIESGGESIVRVTATDHL
jgi:2-dehydropantoate 2-reductase